MKYLTIILMLFSFGLTAQADIYVASNMDSLEFAVESRDSNTLFIIQDSNNLLDWYQVEAFKVPENYFMYTYDLGRNFVRVAWISDTSSYEMIYEVNYSEPIDSVQYNQQKRQ